MYLREPHRDMRLPGSKIIESYMPLWAKEKQVRVWDSKGEEVNSQGDKKTKCLVNKCLPCHVDKSFWYKKCTLVVALFLAQAPFLNCLRQWIKK